MVCSLRVALLVAAWAVIVAATATAAAEDEEESIRLPVEAVPRRYRLDITPYMHGDFHFEGEVWIELEAVKPALRITLHRGRSLSVGLREASLELLAAPGSSSGRRARLPAAAAAGAAAATRHARERQEAGAAGATGAAGAPAAAAVERAVRVLDAEEPEGGDRVALLLDEALMPGRLYRLRLAFNGSLSDDLTGFYKVSFREGNAIKWIASTVFEPAEARRAFPCLDEPALKARFQVNVGRPENLVALSNMPLRVTEPKAGQPGWVWDRFEESPPMPTYLVAWAVGPLESRSVAGGASAGGGGGGGGGQLRVWGRPSVLRDAQYALDTGDRIRRFLAEWLDEPDPLPKMDLLALPSFVSDALENWGLVSFGERYLLPAPNSSSAISRVGFILGHELAHTYFGNMVTLEWWDAIWLNEGFATYFGSLALDRVQPELKVQSTTAVRAFLEVFAVDALRSSHALTAAAAKSSDLYQIFDSITYYKGYYVLRMLNHSLGEETFRRGVQRYVRGHRFGTARESDLWAALGEQARLDGATEALPARGDLAAAMAAWTRRPGYPLLELRRRYDDDSRPAVTITQERFLRSPGDVEKSLDASAEDAEGWWVPLTLTWPGGPKGWEATRPVAWLDPARPNTTLDSADLPLPPADAWLLANVDAAGLYRVNYDARNWALLGAALRRDARALPLLNRALLLDDALDLARAGRLPYATALDMLRYLRAESGLAPWLAALGDLDYLHRMLPPHTEAGTAFQRFLLQLLGPRFAELGLEPRAGEPAPDALARRLLARWACALGDAHCVRASVARFSRWRVEPDIHPIPADMRSVVLCTAVEQGMAGDWEFLWERYAKATSSAERSGVLQALGCSRDPATLARYLQLSIQKDSPIRKQHSATVFEAVAKNPVGHSIAKEFLSNNIDRIQAHVGTNPFHLPQLLQALAYRMNTQEELRELERLQAEHQDTLRLATRTLQQSHETVRFNIDWVARHREDIASWLRTAPQAVAPRPAHTHNHPHPHPHGDSPGTAAAAAAA